MKALPLARGAEIVRAFGCLGWHGERSTHSHYVLSNPNAPHVNISIPAVGEVKRPLLRTELRKAGISPAEFIAAFRGKATA